ncbi:MAG TPA: hypothetical protein VGE01_12580 [Fimbriimonas sp.]
MFGSLLAALVFAQPGYAQWSRGPSKDPAYFPIAVWLQQPKNAKRFQQAGINLYVGLWQGPTEEQLKDLKAAGMPVICDQNEVGLKHLDDPTIVAWMHNDEPDNAQAKPGGGWGPCIPPQRIVDDYRALKAKDPSRPIFLNLGQGVANDSWVGRGEGASLKDYETYVKGADIVSYDVYPVAGLGKPDLWLVAKGLDRLAGWTEGKKTLWNCIETGRIDLDSSPTPEQVRSQVWMSLIHGSKGLIYFVHQFKPTFNEHALLDDPAMLAEVTRTNGQIRSLAPVLNSPTVRAAGVEGAVDLMAKRHEGDLYVFACGMKNEPARGKFTLRGLPRNATAEVLGEGRTVKVVDGRFDDDFGPFEVHLYRVRQ